MIYVKGVSVQLLMVNVSSTQKSFPQIVLICTFYIGQELKGDEIWTILLVMEVILLGLSWGNVAKLG